MTYIMKSLASIEADSVPLRPRNTKTVRVLLVSTYELGRQPFGLASPAACLRADGHQVTCTDLAVEKLSLDTVRNVDLIAFHLPMHTATRLAVPVIEAARSVNPGAHVCCYGLYAPVNAVYLRSLGVETLVGGEFVDELRCLAQRLAAGDRSLVGYGNGMTSAIRGRPDKRIKGSKRAVSIMKQKKRGAEPDHRKRRTVWDTTSHAS